MMAHLFLHAWFITCRWVTNDVSIIKNKKGLCAIVFLLLELIGHWPKT